VSTNERVREVALASFATRGYEATSLDALARELGVRKQTILYYHGSKEALLLAVIDDTSLALSEALEAALVDAGSGFDRIEALVRSVFRLALRRPELLGLLRELSRLGPPATDRLMESLGPLVDRARGFLEEEMAAGRMRQSDPNMVLLSAYSTVIGMATEVEVLRALGMEPTMKSLVLRRRELIEFLRRALLVS
jgi:AcrR family transcriptional regulator